MAPTVDRDPPAGLDARGALGEGEQVELVLDPARRYWLHVAQGGAVLDGHALSAAMRWAWWTRRVRVRCRAAAPKSRTCCSSTCRPDRGC
jgi:hypothetical protein